MSHDKIRAAARRRMTATGETYTAARRQAISEHAADAASPVSAEDVLAAAEVHRELGPDYSGAVVASFIEKVDRAVAARVEARLAEMAQTRPAKPVRRKQRPLTRRMARDVLAASAGALIAVGAVGLYDITSTHPGSPAGKLANGACTSRVGNNRCLVPAPAGGVQTFEVTGDGKLEVVKAGPGSGHQ